MYATKRATTYGYSLWEFQVYGTPVPTNQPPVLAAIPDQTILAGRTLLVTNLASDPNVPPLPLTFSLFNPPAGASINANTGLFTWRPTIAQSPSTQTVSVVVSDNELPPLTATQSFNVTVNQPASPTLSRRIHHQRPAWILDQRRYRAGLHHPGFHQPDFLDAGNHEQFAIVALLLGGYQLFVLSVSLLSSHVGALNPRCPDVAKVRCLAMMDFQTGQCEDSPGMTGRNRKVRKEKTQA